MLQSLKKFRVAKFILNALNSEFVLGASETRIKCLINLSKEITALVKKNLVIDVSF